MKCEWCGRSFKEKESDGICPSCGGLHEIPEKKYEPYKEPIRQEKQDFNKSQTTAKTMAKKRKGNPVLGIAILLVLGAFMFLPNLFTTSSTNMSTEVEITEEAPAIENVIPDRYSHIVPTKAIVEGDIAIGLPEGSSGAVTIIPEGVKHIADFAFANEPIMAVIFPESLETIGEYAFYDCYDLEYAKLPDNLKIVGNSAFTYAGDDMVVEYGEVPESMERVGNYSFNGWKVHSLPEGIQLNEGSFDYSEYSVGIDEQGMIIVGNVFLKYAGSSKNITIPDGIVLIDAYSFMGNEAIETVVMPESVEFIGSGAFYAAESLQTVVFSPNITSIGNNVFEECESLKSAQLPEGMLHIGDDVFVGCDDLHELHIPSTLITASRDSFDGCAWYYDNYIGGAEQWIFGDGILAALYTTYETDIQYLPDGIKRIGKRALFLTYDREEIIIPEGVEVINDGAISAMTLDDEVILDIPDSVTEIIGRPISGGIGGGLDVIIRCTPDSYAFQYAQENGYEIIPK